MRPIAYTQQVRKPGVIDWQVKFSTEQVKFSTEQVNVARMERSVIRGIRWHSPRIVHTSTAGTLSFYLLVRTAPMH
jgi:hypothetical protein